jgi:hypothetical protein
MGGSLLRAEFPARAASRAANRNAMLPPGCASTTLSGSIVHAPARTHRVKGSRPGSMWAR